MLKKSVVLLAAMLLGAACGGSPKISGVVQLEGGGDAGGVIVQLAGGEGGARVVVTAADGAYAFDGLADGTYALAFEAADTLEGRQALAVSLKDGKGGEVPAVRFTGAARVTGKVTTGAATGNAGIEVAVAGTTLRAITADDGTFSLEGVASGDRVLVATRDGYVAQSPVTVQRGVTEAAPFVLGRNALRPATVKGSVRHWDLRSSADVTLTVPGLPTSVALPADGAFSVALPAGTWELVAAAPTYPRQVIARVTVQADETLELGARQLRSAYRFAITEDTQYQVYTRLLADGRHAIVSREGYEQLTHAIADLETGTERTFLVEWDWVTDVAAEFYPSNDGHFVSYGATFRYYDGGWRDHATFSVVDTVTGAVKTARGVLGTQPTRWQQWGYSSDAAVFFAADTQQLHRIDVATGQDTAVKADVAVVMPDADHRLAIAKGEAGATVGIATWLAATGAPKTVLTGVRTDHVFVANARYALIRTDCDVDTSMCAMKIVDLRTGEVTEVSGGPYSLTSALYETNHPEWARIQGSQDVYVRLTDGTATPYPTGFTRDAANNAQISPDGTRLLFYVPTGAYPLHVAAMPPTAVPEAPATSVSGPWSLTWIGPARFAATPLWAPDMLVHRSGDAQLDVAAEEIVAGSVEVRPFATTWRRASDGAWMVLLAEQPTALRLTDADPDHHLTLETDVWQQNGTPPVFRTADGGWTLFTVFDRSTGRFTSLGLKTGTTTFKRYPDFLHWGDPDGYSNTGVVGSLLRFGASWQDVVLDYETGTTRLTYETDVTDWNWGYRAEDAAATYLMMTYLTNRTTWNGNNVYEGGLLKF